MGYMIVKSEIDSFLFLFYLPKNVTENQKNWFLDHRYLNLEYFKIGAVEEVIYNFLPKVIDV